MRRAEEHRPHGDGFQVTVCVSSDGPGLVEVALTGELDLAAGADLEAGVAALLALRQDPRTTPLAQLDLSGLRFMDSSGLDALLARWDALRAAGWHVRLTGPPRGQCLALLRFAAGRGWLTPAGLPSLGPGPWLDEAAANGLGRHRAAGRPVSRSVPAVPAVARRGTLMP